MSSFFVTTSPFGGEHSSVSISIARTLDGKIVIVEIGISVGPSVGTPFGYERVVPSEDELLNVRRRNY